MHWLQIVSFLSITHMHYIDQSRGLPWTSIVGLAGDLYHRKMVSRRDYRSEQYSGRFPSMSVQAHEWVRETPVKFYTYGANNVIRTWSTRSAPHRTTSVGPVELRWIAVRPFQPKRDWLDQVRAVLRAWFRASPLSF